MLLQVLQETPLLDTRQFASNRSFSHAGLNRLIKSAMDNEEEPESHEFRTTSTELDMETFRTLFQFYSSKFTPFQNNGSSSFCWHLIERAKANSVFPQALNYLTQVISARFTPHRLPVLIHELLSRNDGIHSSILNLEDDVKGAYEARYDPNMSILGKWYKGRIELAQLGERFNLERVETDNLNEKRKKRMREWKASLQEAGEDEEPQTLHRPRSSIITERKTPWKDSQLLLEVKVAAFADIFLTTKALFFSEDDCAHYTHAELVVEKVIESVVGINSECPNIRAEKRVRKRLDEYVFWLMESRKQFSPWELSFILPRDNAASTYRKTFMETRQQCTEEDARQFFPSAKIGIRRPVDMQATFSWKEHGPVRCMPILAYESSLILLVVFRCTQEQVYKKNLMAHNTSTIHPQLELPILDVVEIPDILKGIEEYRDPSTVAIGRRNAQPGRKKTKGISELEPGPTRGNDYDGAGEGAGDTEEMLPTGEEPIDQDGEQGTGTQFVDDDDLLNDFNIFMQENDIQVRGTEDGRRKKGHGYFGRPDDLTYVPERLTQGSGEEENNEQNKNPGAVTPHSLERVFHGDKTAEQLARTTEQAPTGVEEEYQDILAGIFRDESNGLGALAADGEPVLEPGNIPNPALGELENNPSFNPYGAVPPPSGLSGIFDTELPTHSGFLFGQGATDVQEGMNAQLDASTSNMPGSGGLEFLNSIPSYPTNNHHSGPSQNVIEPLRHNGIAETAPIFDQGGVSQFGLRTGSAQDFDGDVEMMD